MGGSSVDVASTRGPCQKVTVVRGYARRSFTIHEFIPMWQLVSLGRCSKSRRESEMHMRVRGRTHADEISMSAEPQNIQFSTVVRYDILIDDVQ